MSRSEERGVIVAGEVLPADAGRLYDVLSDLDRHRALTDGGLRIVRLDGPAGQRTGGLVLLRGPVGLRKVARTAVHGSDPGRRLWGSATTKHGTRADLDWSLRPRDEGTCVEVTVRVTPRHWSDRLLWRIGGSVWLRRRLRVAIRRLGQAVDQAPAPPLRSLDGALREI